MSIVLVTSPQTGCHLSFAWMDQFPADVPHLFGDIAAGGARHVVGAFGIDEIVPCAGFIIQPRESAA